MTPEFTTLKREIVDAIREETLKTMNAPAIKEIS